MASASRGVGRGLMITAVLVPVVACALVATSGQGGARVTSQSIANLVLFGDWARLDQVLQSGVKLKHPIHTDDEFDVLLEIFMSTSQGREDIVERGLKGFKICVKHGADPNEGRGTLLRRLAAGDKGGRYIRALLKLGADPNLGLEVRSAKGELLESYFPLGTAIETKNPMGVAALLKAKADPDAFFGRELVPPLALAARTGQTDMMEWLIKAGATVDLIDPLLGQSALHAAAKANQIDAIQLLLRAKANRSLIDVNGLTPLKLAEKERALAAVRVLSDRKKGGFGVG